MTEEVSLMAVPAKRPNPSFPSPKTEPRVGKISAAATLKRKITEIAWAISSSSASMTGAVAAMAEPPQMEEPTPISVEILDGIFKTLLKTKAVSREMEMVDKITGSDCFPFARISDRFMPNPNKITAYCNIFLDVYVMPA